MSLSPAHARRRPGASLPTTERLSGGYLRAVRIETAKAILESDDTPIQAVAAAVGYDDTAHFRELFKRMTGITPAEYRAHFAALGVAST
jgi:AraC-like DNA-binding protein